MNKNRERRLEEIIRRSVGNALRDREAAQAERETRRALTKIANPKSSKKIENVSIKVGIDTAEAKAVFADLEATVSRIQRQLNHLGDDIRPSRCRCSIAPVFEEPKHCWGSVLDGNGAIVRAGLAVSLDYDAGEFDEFVESWGFASYRIRPELYTVYFADGETFTFDPAKGFRFEIRKEIR